MPPNWKQVTVDEIKAPTPNALAMGPFGSNIKTDNFVQSGVPVIRGTNLSDGQFKSEGFVYVTEQKADELRSANAFPGDLVFTHRGTLGQVGIIPEKGQYKRYIVSQSQMKLTCDRNKADPLFMYYFFRSPKGQNALLSNTSTTGVPAIAQPLKSLKTITIDLPPLAEQKIISKTLGVFEHKIAINDRVNAILQEIIQTIFKSWFVDFNFPDEVGKPYNTSGRQVINSTSCNIPKGWRIEPLRTIVDLKVERNDLSSKDNEKYIALDDMPSHSIDLRKHRSGSEVNSSIIRFRKGDILFGNMRPYFHKVGLAQFDGITRTTTFVLRPKKNYLRSFALMHFFSNVVVNYSTSISIGTTIPYVTWEALGEYRVPIPPDELLYIFEDICEPILDLILRNSSEIQTITKIVDTILPKLLSGSLLLKGTAEDSA